MHFLTKKIQDFASFSEVIVNGNDSRSGKGKGLMQKKSGLDGVIKVNR